MWFYLGAFAVLLGGLVNAEMARRAHQAAPDEAPPFLGLPVGDPPAEAAAAAAAAAGTSAALLGNDDPRTDPAA